jgi:hypothetical protein
MSSQYSILLACDVESWRSRPAAIQHHTQKHLARILNTSASQAGLPIERTQRSLRGDGELWAVPPEIPKEDFSTKLIACLDAALDEYNAQASEIAQIRLRLALHAGDVVDGNGQFSGPAVVHVCDLVEAGVLRRVLRASVGRSLALMVSTEWHDSVIAQWHDRSEGYTKVQIHESKFDGAGWIRVPGRLSVPGLRPEDTANASSTDVPRNAGQDDKQPDTTDRRGRTTTFAGPVTAGRDVIGGDQIRITNNSGNKPGGDHVH